MQPQSSNHPDAIMRPAALRARSAVAHPTGAVGRRFEFAIVSLPLFFHAPRHCRDRLGNSRNRAWTPPCSPRAAHHDRRRAKTLRSTASADRARVPRQITVPQTAIDNELQRRVRERLGLRGTDLAHRALSLRNSSMRRNRPRDARARQYENSYCTGANASYVVRRRRLSLPLLTTSYLTARPRPYNAIPCGCCNRRRHSRRALHDQRRGGVLTC